MTAPTWTEAHRREALRRTYELAAELVGRGDEDAADTIACFVGTIAGNEDGWRSLLVDNGIGAARVRAEVRRVRALAEGRLVREPPRVVVKIGNGVTGPERRRVRVTRIRRGHPVPAGGVGR